MSIVDRPPSPQRAAPPAEALPRRRARPGAEEVTGLHVAADLAIVTAAYVLAHVARAWLAPSLGALRDFWWVPLVGAAAWIGALQVAGLYGHGARLRAREVLLRVAVAALLVALLLGFAIFVAKAKEASRPLVGLYLALAAAGIALERVLVGALLAGHAHSGPARTLVVGTGPAAARAAALFQAEARLGTRALVGFLDAGDERIAEGPVLGPLADLVSVLDREPIDEVVFALPAARLGALDGAIAACEEVGVRVSVLLPFVSYPGQAQLAAIGGAPVLRYDARPHGPIDAGVKRILDIALSGALLVLLAPLLLAIAAIVRLSSKGPALFIQRRVGLNGREFRLLKFRTMDADAEDRREALDGFNECDGPHFKMREDPRVTRVGRFLRRWSFDELPQLLNVLGGQMSLVGPRPPLRSEVARYERWQRRRLSVRPGITGAAQVSGRAELTFAEYLRLDLAYIDGWSLGLDVWILVRTIASVLHGRGSY